MANPEKKLKVSACCGAAIGFDAWVDGNGEICGGPFDESQCMECGEENPAEMDAPPDDATP